MKKLLLILLLFPLGFAFGQEIEEEVYTVVEKMPLFGTCEAQQNDERFSIYYEEALKCSNRNIITYLQEEVSINRSELPTGNFKSIIQFIVEADGSVSNEKVKISSGNEAIDNSSLEILRKMEGWQAGSQRGQAVRVQYIIPVNFK